MTLPGWAVIHRDQMSLTPLMIDGSSYYKVDNDGIPDQMVGYDIDETSSPFVEGSQVTNDIRGMVAGEIHVQVRAVDHPTLVSAVSTLLAAAQQRNFVLDLVIGGVTWSWSCRRKTYAMPFGRSMVFSRISVVPVQFDRYPTPLAGPF